MVEAHRTPFRTPEEYQPGDILIYHDEIQKRIRQLSTEIAGKYRNKNLLVIGLLKGAYKVTDDMLTQLHERGLEDTIVSFVTVKSYPTGTEATDIPRILSDTDINPDGHHVLLMDDILDTGRSLQVVHQLMDGKGAVSVESCVLLNKPDRRAVSYEANYVGFSIPNVWVQGYGMDSDEYGRANPNIIVGPVTYPQISLQQN